MPKLSKDSAPNVQDAGPAIDRGGDLDDTSVDFVTIRQSHSLAPLLKGLPGDSCQCPHWGYLLAGRITVSYADYEETYEAGDAFYMLPGHVPAAEAGTEFVQFSPREQLAKTLTAMRPTLGRCKASDAQTVSPRVMPPNCGRVRRTPARWRLAGRAFRADQGVDRCRRPAVPLDGAVHLVGPHDAQPGQFGGDRLGRVKQVGALRAADALGEVR